MDIDAIESKLFREFPTKYKQKLPENVSVLLEWKNKLMELVNKKTTTINAQNTDNCSTIISSILILKIVFNINIDQFVALTLTISANYF